jgi:hypothetical protein
MKPLPLSNPLRVKRCIKVFEYLLLPFPPSPSFDAPQVEKEPGNKQRILKNFFISYK